MLFFCDERLWFSVLVANLPDKYFRKWRSWNDQISWKSDVAGKINLLSRKGIKDGESIGAKNDERMVKKWWEWKGTRSCNSENIPLIRDVKPTRIIGIVWYNRYSWQRITSRTCIRSLKSVILQTWICIILFENMLKWNKIVLPGYVRYQIEMSGYNVQLSDIIRQKQP